MPTKPEILNNLREYTADEIAEAIKAGTVTVYELSKTGHLTPLMRQRIEERLAAKTAGESPSAPEAEPAAEDTAFPQAPDTTTPSEAPMPEPHTATAEPARQEAYTSTRSNKGMFRHPFSFHGRIRRREYWLSMIIWMPPCWVLVSLFEMFPSLLDGIMSIMFLYLSLVYWFFFAQGAKRSHDIGASGWMQLIPFYWMLLLCLESDKGPNEYGDSPKE